MGENEYRLPLLKVGCAALVEDKEKAWFLRLKTNELCEIDRKNHEAKILKRFTDAPMIEDFLYLPIEKVGDILILAPGTASHLVFYDLSNDMCEYIELAPIQDDRKLRYTGVCNFLKSYVQGNSVYLFGYEYPAIVKIDMATKEIAYLDAWVMEVEQRIKKVYASMGYVSDYAIVGNFVWMLCECVNAVLCLDLRTDKIEIIDICSDLVIQCGICFDGNFWVTGNNEHANKLLKYNNQFVLEKEIEIYSVKDGGEEYFLPLEEGYWATYPVLDLGEKLFLFSVYPSHVYEFDKASEQVRIQVAFEKLMEVRGEKLYDLKILAPRKKDNIIYFVTGNDFLWNEYDFIHDMVTQYEVRTERDEELLQGYSKFLGGKMIAEDSFVWNLGYKMTLSRFLRHAKYALLEETDNMGKTIV